MPTIKKTGIQIYFFFSFRGFVYNKTSGELVIECNKKITKLQVREGLDYGQVITFFMIFTSIK